MRLGFPVGGCQICGHVGEGQSGSNKVEWGDKNWRNATTTGDPARDKARNKQHSDLTSTQSSDTIVITNHRKPEETATFNMADVRAIYKDFDNGYKQCSPTYNLTVLCTVPYPASYAQYRSLKAIYIIL